MAQLAHSPAAPAPATVRPRAGGVRFERRALWLRHLDLVATPSHEFERAEGPRLRRFPDWSRSPVAPRPR